MPLQGGQLGFGVGDLGRCKTARLLPGVSVSVGKAPGSIDAGTV
jgi:hypothetical protein